MTTQNLVDTIQTLSPKEQEAVREFILYMKQRESTNSPIMKAAYEFIATHPELLQRLAE